MPPESPDCYQTLAKSARAEPPKSKGSRFIADAFPVADAAEAAEWLAVIRKREHAASHHCWAYRIGPTGEVFRYSDDGEPSGSAGLPIHREIESRELTNVIVVVTRYYGGTKLGTGGLVRAYSEAAASVLDAAEKREIILRVPVRLTFEFADTSPAMHTIARFDAEVVKTDYSENGAAMLLNVRKSEVERLKAAILEGLGGRGQAAKMQSDK